MTDSSEAATVLVDSGGERVERQDELAAEEPLEIRLACQTQHGWSTRPISVTMRTPGDDNSLAAGFLFSEGILTSPAQIASIRHVGPTHNVIRIELQPGVSVDIEHLTRNFYTTSSCGVCGKTSIEAIAVRGCTPLAKDGIRVARGLVPRLPAILRESQTVFDRTGGLHASALFDGDGALLSLREDIGRHNALDKLIGAEFLAGRVPLEKVILLVSGRVGFELVQKAIVARIPILAAIGAPSTLAVELAREFDVTLIGFVRSGRFNIYSAAERIEARHP